MHGTILVVNQQEHKDGIPVNEPLQIPETVIPVQSQVEYVNAPTITLKPINFNEFKFDSQKRHLNLHENYDLGWILACYVHRKLNLNDAAESVSENKEFNQSLQLKDDTKSAGQSVMPTWAATNSILVNCKQKGIERTRTNTGIVAPLLRRPPTDYSSLYTALKLAQGISTLVVGPQRRTVITLDLDLYERGIKLQQAVGNSNWLLRAGELHACFASLHALGKYVEGSGLDAICIEEGIYSPATTRQIITGKWYRRGVEYHLTNILACYELLLEVVISDAKLCELKELCSNFQNQLKLREQGALATFEVICSFSEIVGAYEVKSEMGKFLMSYMKQVGALLRLIRSCRQNEWELYLGALEEQVKYYFAHDLYKYARLIPVNIAEMKQLETTDPDTWNSLKETDFSVAKTGIPFSNLFVDQALEQQIRELKVVGGITGLTQNEAALERFMMIAPEVTRLVNEFNQSYNTEVQEPSKKEHYQLSGSMSFRILTNAEKIRQSIVKHCEGNPFITDTGLTNIVSSMAVPDKDKNDIILRDQKGHERFAEYVSNRLVKASAKLSIWDPIKKLNLRTFSNCHGKSICKIGNKLVKLREDRQLLARFLVVQQSRPQLMENIGESIGKYEFSIIPRALFSSDGALLLPTDKSMFIAVIEQYSKTDSNETELNPMTEQSSTNKICIIDAMAVVQSITKGPNMATCADFARAFVNIITRIVGDYNEGRIIFDRYIDNSLKEQTRGKRTAGLDPVKFNINDSTNIKMVPLKTFLSHIGTKAQLTEYLGKAVLKQFESSLKNIIVVFGTRTYGNKPNLFDQNITEHSHEEADTIIPLHVLDAFNRYNACEVDVHSPDTDVFILLIDLYSNQCLNGELRFVTGNGKLHRTIDVKERCEAIGLDKCKGTSWTSCFFRCRLGWKIFRSNQKEMDNIIFDIGSRQ